MITKHMKKVSILALLCITSTYADIIGGEISVGTYAHNPSGTASYSIPQVGIGSEASLEETFGWETDNDFMFKAYIEHPIPFIPNFKLGHTHFKHSGSGLSKDFTWGNLVDFSGKLDSSIDMGMTDATAYYEVLDNYIELDLGLTLRYLFGDITLTPTTTASTVSDLTSYSILVPMVYGKVRLNIPSTNFAVQLETNVANYSDTTLYDYEIGVRYTFSSGLGIESGIKALHLESTDLVDGLNMDLDENGFYASVLWDF
ncbi:hypothetical protein MNB_SV-5-281 [hydrothermal vent metagenome]|uniref:TIGR04219 family outer membrane beta-barrel protein n=1 Tax=hydrothermal vent metagenome TaxID=652676 RepID=A0A1W1EBE7_9ZZZZ